MRLKPPGRCYILGIGGIAMANLACLLKDLGFEVAGSDKGVYPPARDLLEEKGIPYRVGYDAGKVASQTGKTDFFVVGNAVSYGNQELEALLLANAPVFSLPEVLRMFLIQDKRAVVVAGTHGKRPLLRRSPGAFLTPVLTLRTSSGGSRATQNKGIA